jgi:hypothetical protein
VKGRRETGSGSLDLHPGLLKTAGGLRARNTRALQLVCEWLADDSGYDEEVFPALKAELEADRLSYRRRFFSLTTSR